MKCADDLQCGAHSSLTRLLTQMVGLSTAQGYAQVTGKPAAIIVHVVSTVNQTMWKTVRR